MGPFKSDFLRALHERGFIHQITDAAALDARAQESVISAYIGFDATADSLHIGSLVQIMLLRHLQRTGHRPIVLMGGGTTKVGDPSGRDETRQLLTEQQINANISIVASYAKKPPERTTSTATPATARATTTPAAPTNKPQTITHVVAPNKPVPINAKRP